MSRTKLYARRLGARRLNLEIDQNCNQQLLKLKLLLHPSLNTEVCSVCFIHEKSHGLYHLGPRLVNLEHTRRRSLMARGTLTFVSLVKLERAKPLVLHSAAKHAKQAG